MDKVELLKQRVENTRESRERQKKAEAKANERKSLVDASPDEVTKEFWCDTCDLDFNAFAKKHIKYGYNFDTDEAYMLSPIQASYIARCKMGHICRRNITDKHKDPYAEKSRLAQLFMRQNADDFLQPGDPRFELLYGDKLRKDSEAKLELKEREAYN